VTVHEFRPRPDAPADRDETAILRDLFKLALTHYRATRGPERTAAFALLEETAELADLTICHESAARGCPGGILPADRAQARRPCCGEYIHPECFTPGVHAGECSGDVEDRELTALERRATFTPVISLP
jgi:hypothetical protein